MLNLKMKKTKNLTVIIAAGGTGTRFGGKVPKQFAMLGKRPVLWHTLTAFNKFSKDAKIIISMHSESIIYWNSLVKKYPDTPAHQTVEGGKTRFHSVKNALACCPDDGIILVHDAVRPFVPHEVIDRVDKEAEKSGAAIPVISVSDSIRMITKTGSKSVDRKNYVRVQTPQGFKASLLIKAFGQRYCEKFTDEASVVEKLGVKLSLVQGDEQNIKVTVQSDLAER